MLLSVLLGMVFGVAQAPLVRPLPRLPLPQPAPNAIRARAHRISFTLRTDSTIGRWRAIAKDGYDLPKAQATERTANVQMGPGETADFEVRPTKPGEWVLEIKTADPGWYIPLPVIVVPAGTPR